MITLTETLRNTTGQMFTVETHALPRGTWYAVRFEGQPIPVVVLTWLLSVSEITRNEQGRAIRSGIRLR